MECVNKSKYYCFHCGEWKEDGRYIYPQKGLPYFLCDQCKIEEARRERDEAIKARDIESERDEARYWARKMRAERDALKKELNDLAPLLASHGFGGYTMGETKYNYSINDGHKHTYASNDPNRCAFCGVVREGYYCPKCHDYLGYGPNNNCACTMRTP